MREENVNPSNWQTETYEGGNVRQNHGRGGGIEFNLVASSLEPQSNAPEETEQVEEEEKSEKKGAAPVAAAENVSGVRKKLLIPAEEALDTARVAAELVMKDAMEALQRTKQRVMDILHRNSHTPPAAEDDVTKANSEDVNPDQQSERTRDKNLGSLFSEPAMGFVFPLQQRAERINSRL